MSKHFARAGRPALRCLPFFLALACAQATAQSTDDDNRRRAQRAADEQLQREQLQQQTEDRARRLEEPDARLGGPDDTARHGPALPQETPCFAIDSLHLVLPQQLSSAQQRLGASSLPFDAFAFLREALEAYRGQCVGRNGINLISRYLSALLLARGYSTTRIGVPEQDLSAGRLSFMLIPGVIRAIRFAQPEARGIWRTAFPTGPGELLNLRDLEQGLEQMKRVTSQDVAMEIVPSEQPGESDVVISVTAVRPWRLSLSLDDSGAKHTGKMQAGLNLAVDNALGLNDLFTVGLHTDADRKGEQRGTDGNNFSWSVPYGYWTFGIAGGGYRYHQQIAGRIGTVSYSGQSNNLDARIAWLFQRDQQQKNSLQFKTGKRWSRSFVNTRELDNQRRNTTFAELAWIHKRYLGNAQLDLTLANRWGTGWFNGDADPAHRLPGDPTLRYTLQTLDATLMAPFRLAGRPFTYIGTLRAQNTQSALYASEQFTIGNRYTVRGFDGEMSLSAERGLFVRNEIDMPLGADPRGIMRRQSLYVGLDAGKVFGPNVENLVGDKLAGTALGVRGSVGGFSYDAFIGWALYKPKYFRTSAQAAGFVLSYRY